MAQSNSFSYLEGTNYTPTALAMAKRRLRGSNVSHFTKMVDPHLSHALLEALEDNLDWAPHNQFYIDELKKSFLDPKITKNFNNHSKVYENAASFHSKSTAPAFWNRNFRKAISWLEQCFKVSLTPLSFGHERAMLDALTNKRASAGVIAEGTKADNVDVIFRTFTDMKRMIQDGEPIDTLAMSFHRSQISKYLVDGKVDSSNIKYKDRLVWGLDGATTTIEAQYAIPLIEYMSSHVTWYAGGKDFETLHGSILGHLRNTSYWYSLDFSGFDQTVPGWLIDAAFQVIKKCFPQSAKKELEWIAHNFIHTKLLLPDGSVFIKHKGIPSGSFFTQAVGSICNALVIMTYLISVEDGERKDPLNAVYSLMGTHDPRRVRMFTMGDDNLFMYRKPVDIRSLARYVSKVFGMKIHPDKTDFGEGSLYTKTWPKFLKRQWSVNGIYRDPLEVFVNVCHPERWRSYKTGTPWDILIGLWITYPSGFRKCFTLEYLYKRKVQSTGDVGLTMEYRELPGSLKALGNKGVAQLDHRLKRLIRYVDV